MTEPLSAFSPRPKASEQGPIDPGARHRLALARTLLADLRTIRQVHGLRLPDQTLDYWRLDLLSFLGDTLIDQILYALYRPPAAAQATCEVVEHFLYCLAPGADRTPVPAVPQPSAPANGKLGFDIWVHFAPRFLALSPADRARRLACYNLPWRPNDLNLWRTNNGRVDFVARHGDLTLVRSHYAAA